MSTVFDAREKLGGLNEYGIAAYKTVDGIAQREVAYILDAGGIEVRTGAVLGRDVTLSQLRADFDAVFLGLGLGGVNALRLEQEDVAGVYSAVDYIADLRQSSDLSTLPVGRRIIVIGGGMTAIDIADQTKRLGAEDVTIVYRRGRDEMNASELEQQIAQTSGVTIKHWASPVRLLTLGGQLSGVEFAYTHYDESGRLVNSDDRFTLPADMLFKAIGQTFVPSAIESESDALALDQGRIAVSEDRQTSLPDVWAGGDCVPGGEDLTVVAVEDGKIAAQAIDRFLRR